ncbi:MAG: glycosyltransferase family 4 protein [Parcubacteria group bacterium]|nr:glycosyltransferase family 4 protein [Parcubacteria group bacterium]
MPAWTFPHVSLDQFHYSNKLLHTKLMLFGRPQLQAMVEQKRGVKLDRIFLPNQNFFKPRPSDRLTITVHDLSFVRFPQFFTPFHRLWHRAVNLQRLVSQADQVIAVSQATANDLQALWQVPDVKIHVSALGLDPLFFNAPDNSAAVKAKYNLPDRYVLFLGTLEPRKNCESVIRAFDRVAETSPETHLILAGGWGWETDGIKKVLASAKHRNRIRLLGYVDRADKPALYRGAAVFVFPSFYEGFGFPVLEAMSQGCPVITSTASSLPELAGDAAICVPPHDVNMLAEAMQSVLHDPQSYTAMIEKAQVRSQQFRWEDTAKRFIDLIKV